MKDNKFLALKAIEIMLPSIEKLFEQTNRKELHIIIMDPALKPWEASFEDAILVEKSLGSPDEWAFPFDELARKKAKQAWRESTANIQTQMMHPSRLRDDDLLYYGSFVYGNIIVACSGVEQWYDMLISAWIAISMEQLAVNEYQKIKINNPTQQYRN